MRFVALAVLVTLSGCFDDDTKCLPYDRAAEIAAYELRDPVTGTCQDYGGGTCDSSCGPCPLSDQGAQALPDWAQCWARCEGLDESTCKGTSGCRAIFAGSTFHQCWGVAMSGPVQGGNCTGLDAHECSRHDDCVATHATGSPIGSFQSCAPESDGQDPGSCVGDVTCAMPAPLCPTGTLPGRSNGCWTGYCIPLAQCDELPACSSLDEMDCIGRADCTPTYEGHDCTCNGTSCTCQTWIFEACEAS